MRLALILALCCLMIAGCTSVDVQVEVPNDILAFYQENPMPMPNLFSDPTTSAGDSGVPEDIASQ